MSFGEAGSGRAQHRRGTVVLAGLLLLLLGLGGRLVYINTTLRPMLTSLAQQQQSTRSLVPARRGMILDRQGRVAATSRQMPDVFVDSSLVEDVGAMAHGLAARLNLSKKEIMDRLIHRPSARYLVVARQVDEVTADAVRAMRCPAVGLTDHSVRAYPLGESMAHVIGMVGRGGHGLEGMELAFDAYLSGRDGERSTIRDAKRRALWREGEGSVEPVDGGHVVLTLDAEIQRITEEALDEGIAQFEAKGGVAIVLAPATGDILAMACRPTFNPNDAADAVHDERRNQAVTDPVEPGSTIKGFIACGALAGGHVSPTELIDCHMGTYHVGKRTITDTHPYGMMNLAGIIKKSSNIGMTIVGERMGKQALHDTVRGFGFGAKTGIECPGENAGRLTSLRKWSTFTSQSVSFGYEITMTPLQLISAFSGIVNDGVQMKPRVVKQLLGPDGSVVESREAPVPLRRVTPSKVARYVSEELLTGVVEEGTGHEAKLEHYRVLGKTGTAKLTYPKESRRKGYEPGAYLSTFIGAAPAEAPRVVVMVMIRRPNASLGYYGGTVSAPAVRRILAESLVYLQVPYEDSAVVLGEP